MRSAAARPSVLALALLFLANVGPAVVSIGAAEPPEAGPVARLSHPGLTPLDISFTLERLVADEHRALEVLAPLTASGRALTLPAEALARVEAPPPLGETVRALAPLLPAPPGSGRLDPLPPLPADLERALSALGQAVLGARDLVGQDNALAGAALLQRALVDAKPVLQRHAVLLGHDAYSGLARDEPGTRSVLTALAAARSAPEVLRAAGLEPAPPRPVATAPALSEALGRLYAALGVPVSLRERAALAAADGLAPTLRDPLRVALAHVLDAVALREQAFAAARPVDLALLAETDAAVEAAMAPEPTPGQVLVLAGFGAAAARVDQRALRAAGSELLAAAEALRVAPTGTRFGFDMTGAGFRAQSTGGDGSGRSVRLGTLTLELQGQGGAAGAALYTGDSDLPALQLAGVRAAIDPVTAVVTLYEDGNGDLRPQPEEVVFASAPLALPDQDILFQDPYAFVVVSGTGRTDTSAALGGRRVEVAHPLRGPGATPDAPSLGLAALDRALRGQPTLGIWPYARSEGRALWTEVAGDAEVPAALNVTVNPAGDQVLRWDAGGDDRYRTNAAGAGHAGPVALPGAAAGRFVPRGLPVSLLVDLGGDDTYATTAPHTLAGANASVALLVDAGGRDTFRALAPRSLAAATAGGLAVLLAGHGASTFTAPEAGVAHAAGAGTALLVKAGGDDSYTAGNASLAASDLGSLALLADLGGADRFEAGGLGLAASRGGVAVLLEAQGPDAYHPRDPAQAMGHVAAATLLSSGTASTTGPARLAVLLDAAGDDLGGCDASTLRGVVRLGFTGPPPPGNPAAGSPYDPAFGLCLDLAVAPFPDPDAGLAVPPTFFASRFGNFTLPGLARLGTPGNDTVPEPYVLSVDLLGHDTYGAGAVAVSDAAGAIAAAQAGGTGLGMVGPVSLVVDADGSDLFDANLSALPLPGHFGYAAGGVAVQATWQSDLAGLAVDGPAMDNATHAVRLAVEAAQQNQPNATRDGLSAAARGLGHATELAPRHGTDTYLHLADGLAAATGRGVAVVLSEGARTIVGPAPSAAPGASCRMACARAGGIALGVSVGGPGDVVEATPFSLGAVMDEPAGGLAVWWRRGGPDQYLGSAASMGVVRPSPRGGGAAEPALHLVDPVARAPAVALFVKDGFSRDNYSAAMRMPGAGLPRGDNRLWEERAPLDGVSVLGPRQLVVAQGIDNLDWYLHRSVAQLDQGVAPNLGPATPKELQPTTLMAPLAVPGALAGSGDNTTGPYGVRPVSFARTALAPGVTVSSVTLDFAADVPMRLTNATFTRFNQTVTIDVNVTDPPAMAEARLPQLDRFLEPGTPPTSDGTTVQRVELVVQGTGPLWRGCPVPELQDAIWPEACVVARWDRDEDPYLGNANVTRDPVRLDNVTQLTWFRLQWSSHAVAGGAYVYPPGPYVVTVRGYAARPDGVPLHPFGIREGMLDTLWGEAANRTDDRYGLYGAAFHVERPMFNAPLPGDPAIRDRNRTLPARVQVNVSEPVTAWGIITNVQASTVDMARDLSPGRNPACDPGRTYRNFSVAVVVSCIPATTSPLFGDLEGYLARGADALTATWDAVNASTGAPLPEGRYHLYLYLRGEHSNVTVRHDEPLAVDFEPFDARVDTLGLRSTTIRRADTPEGTFEGARGPFYLPVEPDPGFALHRGWHLWVQDDLLDPADRDRVLESRPWSYYGLVDQPAQLDRRTEPVNRTFTGIPFQGEAFPGPPHRYRFAVYYEDRAGNRVEPNPATRVPEAADCVEDEVENKTAGTFALMSRCAEVRYDVTPPQTKVRAVSPPPELPTIALGQDVRLLVDATQTPDVTNLTLLAAVATPQLEPAMRPCPPPFPDDGRGCYLEVGWRNLTAAPEGPLELALPVAAVPELAASLAHNASLRLLVRGTDWVGNVEEKASYDATFTVDLLAPQLLGRPEVEVHSDTAVVVWETDEPSVGTVFLTPAEAPAAIAVPEPLTGLDALRTRHEVRLAGLLPGTPYSFSVASVDAVGNRANLSLLNGTLFGFRTHAAIDLQVAALPPVVARPTELRWTAVAVERPLVQFRVQLSTDAGRTFPVRLAEFDALAAAGDTWNVTLDPRLLPESGQARVRVFAHPVGDAGALSFATSAAFVLDGVAPRSRLEASAGLANWTNAAVEVRVTAEDQGAGLAAVEWSEDNLTFLPVTGPLRFDGPQEQRLFVRARDRVGNAEVPAPVRILLDGEGPALEARAQAAASLARPQVGVEVRALDNASGLARVVAVDASGASQVLDADAFVEGRAWLLWRVPGEEGPAELALTAYDRAGNAAATTVQVAVDRRAPAGVVRAERVGPARAVLVVEADEPVRLRGSIASAAGVMALEPDPASRVQHRVALEGLSPGATHTAHLVLEDLAGNLGSARVLFATPPDLVPPGPAGDLEGAHHRDGGIALWWAPAKDDVGIARYDVFRDALEAGDSGGRALAQVAAPRFLDGTAEPGRWYRYRVVAVDLGGNPASAAAEGRVLSRAAPVVVSLAAVPAGPGLLQVEAVVGDADGDLPAATVVIAGAPHALERVERTGEGWRLRAVVPAPPAGLDEAARGYHLEATDGLFHTRAPAEGRLLAPAVAAPSPAPGPGLPLLAAGLVVLAAGLRRRDP